MAPQVAEIERNWRLADNKTGQGWSTVIEPLHQGPFITPYRELILGQWGMIPPGSKDRVALDWEGRPMGNHLARFEKAGTTWTFRRAWNTGKRCLVPALWFDVPTWEQGAKMWWRFRRTDGAPWALAGLFGHWLNPQSLQLLPHYSMLTVVCDGRPDLVEKLRPNPLLIASQQQARMVVPLERKHWDTWLYGGRQEAEALIKVPHAALFETHRIL